MALVGKLRSGIGSYALATAYALTALALQWAVSPLVDNRIPFLFFLPLLAVAAATLGPGPATLVLLVGFVNGAITFEPEGSLAVESSVDQVSLLAYLAVGSMLAAWGARALAFVKSAHGARA